MSITYNYHLTKLSTICHQEALICFCHSHRSELAKGRDCGTCWVLKLKTPPDIKFQKTQHNVLL